MVKHNKTAKEKFILVRVQVTFFRKSRTNTKEAQNKLTQKSVSYFSLTQVLESVIKLGVASSWWLPRPLT